MEAIAPATGTHPEFVLRHSARYFSALGGEVAHTTSWMDDAAAHLTNIAITLHRQVAYREAGLRLFEDLLERGVHEAAVALDLLDRKPVHPSQVMGLRRRYRPRHSGDELNPEAKRGGRRSFRKAGDTGSKSAPGDTRPPQTPTELVELKRRFTAIAFGVPGGLESGR